MIPIHKVPPRTFGGDTNRSKQDKQEKKTQYKETHPKETHTSKYGRLEDLRIENRLKEFRARVQDDIPLKVRVQLPSNMEPTFFIGGGNGAAMIEEILTGLGWKRTKDKTDENYRMKWCEVKGQINYNSFKEGEQMVNHIPNCNLLTNKLGLLNSLQEYSRLCTATRKRPVNLDFIPETYRLDHLKDRELFLNTYKEGEVWICKPTGRNQGKGIFMVRSLDEIKKMLDEQDAKKDEGKPTKPMNRIIQRYIDNPLLLDNKKFDIRAYMLVANTTPFLVLYHKGYVRLCLHEYDNENESLTVHLTNQFIQKKDPNYKESKEDTAWSMDRFNEYINEKLAPEKGLEENWVYNTLTNKMKSIMTTCFNAVKHKLSTKIGYSDLYGLDFMIDDSMKVWLIEVNVNPSLATNCEALKEVIPGMVKETIYVTTECFDKCRKGKTLMPLNTLKNFDILHNAAKLQSTKQESAGTYRNQSSSKSSARQSETASPVRRSKTQSPVKEIDSGYKQRSGMAPRQTATVLPVPGAFNSNSHSRTPVTNERIRARLQETPTSRPIRSYTNIPARPTANRSSGLLSKSSETFSSKSVPVNRTSVVEKGTRTSASSKKVVNSADTEEKDKKGSDNNTLQESGESDLHPIKESDENEKSKIKDCDTQETNASTSENDNHVTVENKSDIRETVELNEKNSQKSALSETPCTEKTQESDKEGKTQKRVKSSKVVPPPPTRPRVPKATNEKPDKPTVKGQTKKKKVPTATLR